MKKKIVKTLVFSVIFLIISLSLWVISDIRSNKLIEDYPSKPSDQYEPNVNGVLWALENGVEPDYSQLMDTCDYIDARYDKSDFALSVLVRVMYDYEGQLPKPIKERVKETFLGFKYWMDQPGEDSMCYWSENHQILFASSEYLIGQLYPKDLFTNDQKLGNEHMKMAEDRVLTWLEQRWLYGFSEWYSNNYYKEDLLALSQIIDFSNNELMVIRAKMITDILMYDVATQSYKGTFVSTSGRVYEANKKSGHGNRLNRIQEVYWGFDLEAQDKEGGLDLSFLYIDDYQIPDVIKAIGYDTDPVIIKASNGLNVSELSSEGLLGQADNQIMMQWGMEAFTNPEVINNSMEYISNHNMLSNEFLSDFKMMNISLIKNSFIPPMISDRLNLQTNGIALQRANTYTYKTNNYMLATAQDYHPGSFGDQQHIWTATLSNDVSVFTTHPAKPLSDTGALSGSPNYWTGSGRFPHSVQDENINISIYVLPDKKGFLEESLQYFTHAYFPKALMDKVVLNQNYIFGKSGDTFIAMIGKEGLDFEGDGNDDLIQNGQITYWITELSDVNTESFDEFMNRIYENEILYDEQETKLVYYSNEKKFEIYYQGEFIVDGETVNTEYKRHESPYAETDFKAPTIRITHNGYGLILDFYNGERLIYME